MKSHHSSDTEEEGHANGDVFRKPLESRPNRLSQSSERGKQAVSPAHLGSTLKVGDKPTYSIGNLPVFTSPFQKDRAIREERGRAALLTPESSPPQAQGSSDHISRAAAHQRFVSKASRLNRLAPPKLDISQSSSPVGSAGSHRGSQDFRKRLSLTGPLVASRDLNDALGRRRDGLPVTGLTSLKASKSGADLTSDWDSTAQDASKQTGPTPVTEKDIARAHALLLSSGVKARQISLRAHTIRAQIPTFLLDSVQSTSPEAVKALRVPRKDEHVLAARNLLLGLTTQSATLSASINHFTSTICPSLQTSLQVLDDLVEKQLTPRVQAASNGSAGLGMKLTTTSTLAVKDLNEMIEAAMRRRRRGPLRWLRRLGYGIVEWMVVGLLWAIWLLVSVCRLVIGTVTGLSRSLRWLFWLA